MTDPLKYVYSDPPPSTSEPYASGVHRTTRDRILLVDDEPQVLVALEDLLGEDFDVFTASSAERALQVADNEPNLAVIVSDQRMPAMTGDQLFAALSKRSSATRILVTGFADVDAVVRAVNDGKIFAYVAKPWDPGNVRVTVQRGAEFFRMSRQLAAERQLLVDLMNSTPDAIYIKNRELRLLRANQAFAEVASAGSTEELVGKSLRDLTDDEALIESIERWEQEILSSGVALADRVQELHCQDRRRWFSISKSPIRDSDGAVVGLVGIARDVTDRLATEEALRESEERLRLTFAGSKASLFDWNVANGNVVYSASFTALFGLAGGELSPSIDAFRARIHPDDAPIFDEALRAHLDERKPLNGLEFRAELGNGEIRWFELSGQAIWTNEGRAARLAGSIIDITERKVQAERLEMLTRTHALLSGVNGAIVRVSERHALMTETCRIAVRDGRLAFALVIDVSRDPDRPTVIAWDGVAAAAFPAPLPELLESDWRPGSELWTTLCAGQYVVLDDSSALPFKGDLGAGGHRGVALFPLFRTGVLDGIFALFAPQKGFFDGQQLKLLNDLAGNLSFALDHLAQAERLNFLSYFDELTGLAKRELLLDRINQSLVSVRGQGSKLALILLDLDRFRQVNETLGRQGGDQLLLEVAERLKGALEGDENLARIDSNCFAVLSRLPGDEAEVASFIENTLMAHLTKSFLIDGTELRASARSGIAIFPADGNDADALLANAEVALKKAKASNHRWVFYAPNMNARVAGRLTLETKLRRALELDQFLLHYQPKVELKGQRVVGLEALIRWHDPETGLVPPGRFIPVLEETGLIVEVGQWVMRRAAAQFKEWVDRGLNPPRIAVNVSALQLAQQDFLVVLERTLEDFPLAASGLDLEITESVLMEDFSRNVVKLQAARERGLEVAIDDFGTGYSSLGYLSRLPIDALKIDRSFVQGMADDPQETTIVMTIISLAHSLDLKVVAEGVETTNQARLLRLLRCDQLQGYLVAKPQPAEQIVTFLNRTISIAPPGS